MLAQTSKGTLSGIVTDVKGAVVQGANVTAIEKNRGIVRIATTGELGQYRIDAVEPGNYRVTIRKKGFAPLVLDEIAISGSITTSLNGTLRVGGASDAVVVSSSAQTIQSELTGVGQTISTAEIRNLPISTLSPYALATTLPGCSSVTGGSYNFTNGVAFSCNGTRPRGNNFLIEGQDNNDAGIHGQGLQPENVASVREVTVLLNSASAEYGHGGGAISNLNYQSGTNRFHGAVWDRLSNSAFDANETANLLGILSDNYRENQFGFELGGPLKNNKMFFFASYQGDHFRSSANGGDLPLPTEAGFAVLQQYASNPRIAAMLEAYGTLRGDPGRPANPSSIPLGPDPVTGIDRGSVEMGLVHRAGIPLKYNSPEVDAVGDYNISANDMLHLRYIRTSFNAPYDFFHFPNNLPGFDVEQHGEWQNAGISYTHIFGPTLVNEARLSFGRMGLSFLPRADNVAADFMPTVTIAGMQGWGASQIVPQGRFHDTYQLQDAVSWNKGRHFLKFGVDFADVRVRDEIPYNYYGSISYAAGGGYQALANYMDDYSGGTATISHTFGSPIIHASILSQNYFLQDTWKARPNLTLELGLRYEYYGTPANQLAYPAIDYKNLTCFPCVVRQKGDKEDWGPRLGFAYSPLFWSELLGGDKFVLRGGFGIFYDGPFANILDNTQATSPNSVASSFTNVQGPTRGVAHWSTYLSQLNKTANAKATVTTQVAHLLSPETLQWHLDGQRELPGGFRLDVGYVGTRGEHLYANTFANPFLPNGQRLFPTRGTIVVRDNSADSIYHALQVQADRRYSSGFFLRVSYTLSKMIDDGSEIFTPGLSRNGAQSTWSSVPVVQYPAPRGATDRSLSNLDHRHRLAITYIYDMPTIHARGNFGPWIATAKFLSGLQISGITSFQSGTPYNVTTGFDSNRDGINNDRPSLSNPRAPLASYAFTGDWAGLSPSILCDGPSLWFYNQCNPVSPSQVHWFVPSSGQGNVGRNSLIGPWYTSWAFAVTRNIHLRESHRLKLRAEIFNPFNQTHKDGDGYWPNMQLVSGVLPSGSATASTFANFATSIHGGRTLRLLLEYEF